MGVHPVRTPDGLFLSEHRYVKDLLIKFNIPKYKPISTPLPSWTTLSLTIGELLFDTIEYRNMVGSLQHLIMTRLDIFYIVNLIP